MGDNKILLGKRHILFYREQVTTVEGWSFSIPLGVKVIAGGSVGQTDTVISLYNETEKVAQLTLRKFTAEDIMTIQTIASDFTLEISVPGRSVTLTEKK